MQTLKEAKNNLEVTEMFKFKDMKIFYNGQIFFSSSNFFFNLLHFFFRKSCITAMEANKSFIPKPHLITQCYSREYKNP